jgi:hypothetical protein
LHANPDLDPIRKAHAIAQLASPLAVFLEQLDKKQAADHGFAVRTASAFDKLISIAHEVLAQQVEALRANPDLDPTKKARAIARLAREELRLRALHFRRAAKAPPRFNLAAFLEEAWKEAQPEIERKKRAAHAALLASESEEALAENSADERDGCSMNPSSGGTAYTGS